MAFSAHQLYFKEEMWRMHTMYNTVYGRPESCAECKENDVRSCKCAKRRYIENLTQGQVEEYKARQRQVLQSDLDGLVPLYKGLIAANQDNIERFHALHPEIEPTPDAILRFYANEMASRRARLEQVLNFYTTNPKP